MGDGNILPIFQDGRCYQQALLKIRRSTDPNANSFNIFINYQSLLTLCNDVIQNIFIRICLSPWVGQLFLSSTAPFSSRIQNFTFVLRYQHPDIYLLSYLFILKAQCFVKDKGNLFLIAIQSNHVERLGIFIRALFSRDESKLSHIQRHTHSCITSRAISKLLL